VGGVADSLVDRLQRVLEVSENVVVPEAQDAIATCVQESCAHFVRSGFRMLATIDFDHKTKLVTGEIAKVSTNGCLPSEVMLF
jgi:hypothetical protein